VRRLINKGIFWEKFGLLLEEDDVELDVLGSVAPSQI